MSEPDWDAYSQSSDVPGDVYQSFKSMRREYYTSPTTAHDPTRFRSVPVSETYKKESLIVVGPVRHIRMPRLTISGDEGEPVERCFYCRADQIAVDLICSYHTPLFQVDDQHHNEFKKFKLFRIRERIEGLMSNEICQVFGDCQRFLRSLLDQKQTLSELAVLRQNVDAEFTSSLASIDYTIAWITTPEIQLVQDRWPNQRAGMNIQLNKFLMIIDPNTDLEEKIPRFVDVPRSERFIQLATSVIPVIKLSRTFFHKLSNIFFEKILRHRTINKSLSPFTEMCSSQLFDLSDSPASVFRNLEKFLDTLSEVATPGPGRFHMPRLESKDFTQLIDALTTRMQYTSLLVTLYVVPLLSDSELQEDFKTWSVTWNTQLVVATQHVNETARSFLDSGSAHPRVNVVRNILRNTRT
ncbi:hypothetical protein PSTT_00803 [Puccinia striiformis]|uniref:Uncharacterized protein n=1 Tax=Puccinia striiformis TaxID=27350 RepID=A0A2S4W5V3_9BASI|nr:hypothetical protein PSTT_00803 [Puccinia striiformis]